MGSPLIPVMLTCALGTTHRRHVSGPAIPPLARCPQGFLEQIGFDFH